MKKSVDTFDIIKVFIVICVGVFLFMQMRQPGDSKVAFTNVYDATIKDVDVTDLEQKDNQSIKRFLSINPEDYTELIYLKDTNPMSAREILVVQFKSDDQATSFKETMLQRTKSQKNVFKGYNEEQAQLVDKAVIYVQANYAIYIVHADGNLILTQFKEAL